MELCDKNKCISTLSVPYILFEKYPITWTIELLLETLPYLHTIKMILNVQDNRGKVMELQEKKPDLPWKIEEGDVGLFIKGTYPDILRRILTRS